ncbi:MAG: co-chaperone GroES [Fusobacteriota bacterium]
MDIKPLGERVLLKSVEIEEKTKGGIIIPDSVKKEQPTIGEIVALGDSEKLKNLNKGEKVIYSKYSGTEVKDGETEYIIVELENILATVK